MKAKKVVIIIILLIFLAIIAVGALYAVKKLAPGFANEEISDMTNLVINGSNVTDYLKENNTKVYMDGENVYLSLSDMQNFFDKYIYVDEKYGKVISTYNSNIVTIDTQNGQTKLNDTDLGM